MNTIIVYIAHPYTHDDPVANTHQAIEWANVLIACGFVPYVPHLNLLWHLVTPRPVAFWYDYDLNFLKRCDAVLRVGGPSTGADAEVATAKQHGIPVFELIADMEEWREKQQG